METQYFICEIIKPIKRRNSRTALNKTKSMNKVLSVHTCVEQCLYQFLRDGQCYNGQVPFGCNEFEKQAKGINIEKMSSELETKLMGSIVLQYRKQAEQNTVTANPETEEIFTKLIPFPPMDEEQKQISKDGIVTYVWFDRKVNSTTKTKIIKNEGNGTQLRVIATGGGRVNKNVPKSICTECGAMVQYPHDPKKVTVKCWLCVAKEVLVHKKPETQDIKPKGTKTNGKRTSIPKRKKVGRRNPRA